MYTFRLETQNQARTSLILGNFRPNTCLYLDTLHRYFREPRGNFRASGDAELGLG